jgi:hypothetical protein
MEVPAKGRAKRPARDNAALLDKLVGKPIGEALRIWIEADPHAAAERANASLLTEMPLGTDEVRRLSFTQTASRSTIEAPSGWEALELPSQPQGGAGLVPSTADVVIQDRIIAFLDCLRSGELVAESVEGVLPAAYWARSDAVLCVENSDLELLQAGKRFCSIAIQRRMQVGDSQKGIASVIQLLERDRLGPSDFNKRDSRRRWAQKHAAELGYTTETIEKYLRTALKALGAGGKPD